MVLASTRARLGMPDGEAAAEAAAACQAAQIQHGSPHNRLRDQLTQAERIRLPIMTAPVLAVGSAICTAPTTSWIALLICVDCAGERVVEGDIIVAETGRLTIGPGSAPVTEQRATVSYTVNVSSCSGQLTDKKYERLVLEPILQVSAR